MCSVSSVDKIDSLVLQAVDIALNYVWSHDNIIPMFDMCMYKESDDVVNIMDNICDTAQHCLSKDLIEYIKEVQYIHNTLKSALVKSKKLFHDDIKRDSKIRYTTPEYKNELFKANFRKMVFDLIRDTSEVNLYKLTNALDMCRIISIKIKLIESLDLVVSFYSNLITDLELVINRIKYIISDEETKLIESNNSNNSNDLNDLDKPRKMTFMDYLFGMSK